MKLPHPYFDTLTFIRKDKLVSLVGEGTCITGRQAGETGIKTRVAIGINLKADVAAVRSQLDGLTVTSIDANLIVRSSGCAIDSIELVGHGELRIGEWAGLHNWCFLINVHKDRTGGTACGLRYVLKQEICLGNAAFIFDVERVCRHC